MKRLRQMSVKKRKLRRGVRGFDKNEEVREKIIKTLKRRTRSVLKSKCIKYTRPYLSFLGCSHDHLVDHLLEQYNYKWPRDKKGELYNIDHIVPLSLATTEVEVLKLNNYRNLVLMDPKENCDKSSKIINDQQVRLAYKLLGIRIRKDCDYSNMRIVDVGNEEIVKRKRIKRVVPLESKLFEKGLKIVNSILNFLKK